MAEKAAEKAAVEAKKEKYMAGPLLSEVGEELRDADAPQATQQALLEEESVDQITDDKIVPHETSNCNSAA